MVAAIPDFSDFSELLHLVEGSVGYFGIATIFKKECGLSSDETRSGIIGVRQEQYS